MVSPEGQERWSIQKYTSITGSEWDFNFSEQNGVTTASITIYNESLARLERMIEIGFKEGCAMQLPGGNRSNRVVRSLRKFS